MESILRRLRSSFSFRYPVSAHTAYSTGAAWPWGGRKATGYRNIIYNPNFLDSLSKAKTLRSVIEKSCTVRHQINRVELCRQAPGHKCMSPYDYSCPVCFTLERTKRSLLALRGSSGLYFMEWKNSTDMISATLQHDVGWLQQDDETHRSN